jgi:hypothetical protein
MENKLEKILREFNVHAYHCCIIHGCKYNDLYCPVLLKKIEQKYKCPECEFNSKYYEENFLPDEGKPVLAKIEKIDCNDKSSWYEVVYVLNNEWQSYMDSKTFQDGENVKRWKYVEECFK